MAYKGTRVHVNLSAAKIKKHVGHATEESVERASGRIRDRARRNLRAADRHRTGALGRSIKVTKMATSTPMKPKFRVGTNLQYGRYQEWGIGPVVPKRAKVLRFKPKGSNTFVFAMRTRGFKGAHFMRDAYRATTKKDFL